METQPRRTADLRGLKALVGILGVLVVLGTALVIGIVIHRIYGKPAALAPASGSVPGMLPGLPASNVLAHGERIEGIAGAGGEVALWVSGPGGDRVLLLDPGTGRVAVGIASAP
jgi:hypothetical protein